VKEDEVHAHLLEDQFEIAAGVSSGSGTKQEDIAVQHSFRY
jgi:hypothetical protein